MSSGEKKNMVADDEQVARIISHEWVIDGELQLAAFALAPRETYLSVNRPIVETYDEDVLQSCLLIQVISMRRSNHIREHCWR